MIWKRKQQNHPSKSWKTLALLGTLGWNLVIPIVAGAFIGRFLDQKFGQGHFWTLSLIALGVMITFYNLFNISQSGKDK